MVDFPGLVGAVKALSAFPGWGNEEEGTGYLRFSAPLEIGGVVVPSFALEGGCYLRHPDENVTFELVLGRTSSRPRSVLERIEWRSLQGGHSNTRKRLPGFPRRTEPTHIHPFNENYSHAHRRMINGNMPRAINVDRQIDSFEYLLQLTSDRLNIRNLNLVQRPPWKYDLFTP